MFNLKIVTENSAFEENGIDYEVARILRETADKLEVGDSEGICMDINGNKVGNYCLTLN